MLEMNTTNLRKVISLTDILENTSSSVKDITVSYNKECDDIFYEGFIPLNFEKGLGLSLHQLKDLDYLLRLVFGSGITVNIGMKDKLPAIIIDF